MYEELRMTPFRASLSSVGIEMSALFHETSFQPAIYIYINYKKKIVSVLRQVEVRPHAVRRRNKKNHARDYVVLSVYGPNNHMLYYNIDIAFLCVFSLSDTILKRSEIMTKLANA